MNLSYRAQRRIKRIFSVIAILLVVAVVGDLCWMLWAGRYIIYDRDRGALLDLSLGPIPDGEGATPAEALPSVSIVYRDPGTDSPLPPDEQTPTPISGYYIDVADLKTDISAVKAQLQALPAGTAVMLDLKNTTGHFYYTTELGKTSSEVDIGQMDDLIEYLLSSDLYVIGRIPAFRDWAFGLDNVPCGLPKKNDGGALWMDDTNCYWLDPTSDGTLEYLTQTTMELRLMGFDEIVYTDFRFPNTNSIVFNGDKEQAIADAAATLAQSCATDRFYVSFMSEKAEFVLPAGHSRLYLSDIAPEDIAATVELTAATDPKIQLLFLTATHDTRFDEYCVLRPLDSAH